MTDLCNIEAAYRLTWDDTSVECVEFTTVSPYDIRTEGPEFNKDSSFFRVRDFHVRNWSTFRVEKL